MDRTGPYAGSRLIGEGLRFDCQGCGRCCRGPDGTVFLSEGEGQAVAAFLGLAPGVFLESRTRLVEGRRALVDAPNGDCRFLGPGGCSIYPVRPRQCRAWPFWFRNLRSPEAWRQASEACPGVGRGRLHGAGEILAWLEGGTPAGPGRAP